MICLLFSNIDTWTFSTPPQHTFLVCKCIIRLRICAHCTIFHIICFGINMMSMWHNCIFICFIYVMFFFTRPLVLRILDLIFEFFKDISLQYRNDECILLSEIQHSQPHMTLYCADIFLNCGGNSERNVESLIITLSYHT